MRYFRILFLILSIGLTIISLKSGFFLYEILFGTAFAYLISVVLETLRLSSLYSFSYFRGTKAYYIGMLLYILVAILCFSISVISFNTNIIQKQHKREAEFRQKIEKDILLIKRAYAKQIQEKIDKIEKHKDLMQQRLAKYPSSNYYKQRIQQDDQKIEEILKQKEEFLKSSEQGDIITWIENKSSEVNINIDLKAYKEQDVVLEALRKFLNISKVNFQIGIGVALSLLVEIGILLLAFMSFTIVKQKEKVIEQSDKEVIFRGAPKKVKQIKFNGGFNEENI